MEKSANKRWRESGTTLPFKDWINRENKKKEQSLNSFFEPIEHPIEMVKNKPQNLSRNITGDSLSNTQSTNRDVFGLNKWAIVFSSLLIVGSVSYIMYKKLSTKK